MSKIYLTKEYERDISLVIESLWAQRLVRFVPERLGNESPYEIFIVFYVTSENMQIWENSEALLWYKNCLLEKNLKGLTFIKSIIFNYKKLLLEIEKYWKSGSTSDEIILKKYMKLVAEASAFFSAWYYSLINERTPENIRKFLFDIRSDDEFFASNDVFIKDCIEDLGISRDLANLIFPEEFPNLPDLGVLEKRASGTVSVNGIKNFITTLKQFSLKHPEYYFEGLNDNLAEVQEIRGQIAFKGKTQGRIKIVKNKNQMLKVKCGDILVSPMTTPDFLPAMKKAAAFITDEGGITCHAAIISREMNKPCIIGTKIATKVLRDGDLVEVDADKGVVKILKRKK